MRYILKIEQIGLTPAVAASVCRSGLRHHFARFVPRT